MQRMQNPSLELFHLCLLFILLSCVKLSDSSVRPSDSSVRPSDSYVYLTGNSSNEYKCECTNTNSEYNFVCRILPLNFTSSNAFKEFVSCVDLPVRVVAQLTIDCSVCNSCAVVDLRQMTRLHGQFAVISPVEVEVVNCRVDSSNVGFSQLARENVSVSQGFEMSPFGVPDKLGVGGFFNVNVTYPTDFTKSDCWMSRLQLSDTNLWYLPAYLTHRCLSLTELTIRNSPITWISARDLMAVRGIRRLTLSNCSLQDFAEDAVQTVIDALDAFLQTSSNSSFDPLTSQAVKKLQHLRLTTGRLQVMSFVYEHLDRQNISFALLLGYRYKMADKDFESDIPYGLRINNLDLSGNLLTVIPAAISMLGYLQNVTLKGNRIRTLQHGWLCWMPATYSNSTSPCYWFRAARWTLKILDLSDNLIETIEEIQPWHEVSLTELILSNNRISVIHSLSFLSLSRSLLLLSLNGNRLKDVSLSGLKFVEKLDLSGNKFSSVNSATLPTSPLLKSINLSDNNLKSIIDFAFENLTGLSLIDISKNSLSEWRNSSFRMPNRTGPGDRVELKADSQKVTVECNCKSALMQIRVEQEFTDFTFDDTYRYPALTSATQQMSCTFLVPDRSHVIRPFAESRVSDFLCDFTVEEKVPARFCDGNSTCFGSCIPGCSCFRSLDWEFTSLTCSNTSTDFVHSVISAPANHIDLSDIKNRELLRQFTQFTLKWQSQRLSQTLEVLLLNNSGIHSVADAAFDFKHSLQSVMLHDNRITRLTFRSLSGLSPKLMQLTLHRNRLTWMDPRILTEVTQRSTSVSLSQNSWICNCRQWLQLHEALLNVANTTQVVVDFVNVTCSLDSEFIAEFEKFVKDSGDADDVEKFKNSSFYRVDDNGRLPKLCAKMKEFRDIQGRQMLLLPLIAFVCLASIAVCVFAIIRRHRLLTAWSIVLWRIRRRDSRSSRFWYDALMWSTDSDQEVLCEVLREIRVAAGQAELRLCVPEDFQLLVSSGLPLVRFLSLSQATRHSRKVVMLVTNNFVDEEVAALQDVVKELGPKPEKCLVLLRQSKQRQTAEDRRPLLEDSRSDLTPEMQEAVRRVCHVTLGSADWQFRLARILMETDETRLQPCDDEADHGVWQPA